MTVELSDVERIASEIVDELRGTCNSLLLLLEEKGVVDNAIVLTAIDQDIFECAVCNWWCDMSELSEHDHGTGDNICADCDP